MLHKSFFKQRGTFTRKLDIEALPISLSWENRRQPAWSAAPEKEKSHQVRVRNKQQWHYTGSQSNKDSVHEGGL